MSIYMVSFLVSVIFLIITLYFFKSRRLDFRYCIFFILLSVVLMVISFNVDWVEDAAKLLGVYYAPALLFAFALVFILSVIVYLAVFITNITKRVTRLNQEVAILKEKLEKYEEDRSHEDR